ncbi:MAG: hypothetical protein J6R18_03100 [Kiritimatiellae bacterium]|nr:hypothetical protein [Kiritimatiellia bacterium]
MITNPNIIEVVGAIIKDGGRYLVGQLAQAVNDRKYWDSRKMKCPYCGEDMKQCRHNVDNGLFYGCSAFPKCKCALPCNKAGQINVSDLYRLHEYP